MFDLVVSRLLTVHLARALIIGITYSLRGDNDTAGLARVGDCDESIGEVINTTSLASRTINIMRERPARICVFNYIFMLQIPW